MQFSLHELRQVSPQEAQYESLPYPMHSTWQLLYPHLPLQFPPQEVLHSLPHKPEHAWSQSLPQPAIQPLAQFEQPPPLL